MKEVDDPTRVDTRGAEGRPTPRRIGRTGHRGGDRVSRLAGLSRKQAPAEPGSRTEHNSDSTVTSRIERFPEESTPAPLPPSPAAKDAEGWFEQVPTNPATMPDLEGLASGTNPGHTEKFRRISSTDVAGARSQAWFGASASPLEDDPIRRLAGNRQALALVALIAATCLAVGMVLGALLFGGAPGDDAAAPAAVPCEQGGAE